MSWHCWTQHTRLSRLAWRSSCLWTSLAPPSSARMARSRKVQRHDMNFSNLSKSEGFLFLNSFWVYYFLLIFYWFSCFLQVSARRPASQMASWAWIAAPSPLRRTLRQCGDVHAVSPLEFFLNHYSVMYVREESLEVAQYESYGHSAIHQVHISLLLSLLDWFIWVLMSFASAVEVMRISWRKLVPCLVEAVKESKTIIWNGALMENI